MPSLRSGITSGLGLCIRPYRYASQLVRRYKYFRAKVSPFCSEIVSKGLSNDKCSCEVQNRQHTSSSLHQSSRANKVCVPVQSSSGALEVVSASSDNIVSAEHLPGIHNRNADQASRIFNDRTYVHISSEKHYHY